MTKTYDKKSWDLAVNFLSDEPELDSPANCHELAIAIQEAVELWFFEKRAKPLTSGELSKLIGRLMASKRE
jgi:hypothetical protein